jgi:hypothetical protein
MSSLQITTIIHNIVYDDIFFYFCIIVSKEPDIEFYKYLYWESIKVSLNKNRDSYTIILLGVDIKNIPGVDIENVIISTIFTFWSILEIRKILYMLYYAFAFCLSLNRLSLYFIFMKDL